MWYNTEIERRGSLELNGATRRELQECMEAHGAKSFRAKQLFTHFHKHGAQGLRGSGLPAALIQELESAHTVATADIVEERAAKNNEAVKYALALPDGQIVEAVYMVYRTHSTLCLSTQAGCRMGCTFCASTKNGKVRDLTAGEMLAQYYTIQHAQAHPIDNIVLMGIGEPLDNYDHVVRFLRLLQDPEGRGMSWRNMSLSTCGLVPEILRLSEEEMPINLVVSLHASDDEKRKSLMPVAKRWDIQTLLSACDVWKERTGRRVSFEYTMIEGVNDTPEDAKQLIGLLKGRGAHINLIRLHPIREYDRKSTETDAIRQFAARLQREGIPTTVRRSIGLEEDGACGQLRAGRLNTDKGEV